MELRSTLYKRRSSSSSIAYGDGGDGGWTSPSSMASKQQLKKRSTSPKIFSFRAGHHVGKLSAPLWTVNFLKGFLFFTWIAAIFIFKGSWRSYKNMQQEMYHQKIQHEEEVIVLRDARLANHGIMNHVSQLLKAKKVMEHEAHTASVLHEAGDYVPQLTKGTLVTNWLDQRQRKLDEKRTSLEKRIAEESRANVISKFGVGPHRVEFTVHLIESDKTGAFVVEMAPLELMPHAVSTFLIQVSKKLWDGTIFWHYDGVDHIISAAPLLYNRGDAKDHHFEAMGVKELAFHEYSPLYPHVKYTLGYAGLGPNFYINAIDNTENHGPGGQEDRAEHEADPCFGKIVEGLDIVRDMYKLQLRQSMEAAKKHDWHDDELTKIVSVRILN